MKKNFVHISIIVIVILLSLITYILLKLNEETIIENKILSILPSHTKILIQFKNPDELYNKYLSQNTLFKKISFEQKENLLNLIAKLDSANIHQQNFQIQDYSYTFAQYPNHQWILAFAARELKDINPIKKFLEKHQLNFTEQDGNFLISNHHIQTTPTHVTNDHLKQWMNIFSKTPSPLCVYLDKDALETAFQVQFQGNEILLNGYLFYPDIKNHQEYQKYAYQLNNIDFFSIDNFQFPELHTADENMKNIYSILKYRLKQKYIQLPDLLIFPINNQLTISENIQHFSDSTFEYENFTIHKLKKKFLPIFKTHLISTSDSVLFFTLSENNFCLSNNIESFSKLKDFIMQDFSNSSYFLYHIKNSSPNNIELSGISKYLPNELKINADTNSFDIDYEIFSSLNKNYFSFFFKLKQNPLNNGYLWAYSHHSLIQKIVGFLDDHKTKNYFIFIQDSLNKLICLNANAEKLWEYQLEEPVKSGIFNVDIFKNNKHQILFSTSKSIYLIDRNGNRVGNFPIKFTSELTTPIQLLDYENNKNYRIWFSTQNRYTYNYSLDGKLTTQFRPYYFEETIIYPPAYTSIGQSDDIILISKSGKIIGISRKGDGRFLLKNKLPQNTLNFYMDASNTLQNSYIYFCTDESLNRISISDELKNIYHFNEKISDAQFVSNQYSTTYLSILTDNKLKLYSLKGEELQSINTDTVYSQLNIQNFKTENYFILSNHDMHSVIRFSIDNKLTIVQKNIKSTTLPYIVHLFKDNQPYLIYTQNHQLFIKKINTSQ